MKLYVVDPDSGQKHYLPVVAQDKNELLSILGRSVFSLAGNNFSVTDVKAEPAADHGAVGILVGGLLGAALLSGFGALLGGVVGNLLSQSSNDDEKLRAEQFNRSAIYEVA